MQAFKLSDLQGVDTERALPRVGGDPKLYRKLLREFLISNESFIDEFNKPLQDSSLEDSTRLAQTMKKFAETIGAALK